MIEKPKGLWKCFACGTVWQGSQLNFDPMAVTQWTCGDAFCGANVVEITEAQETEEGQEE